MAAAKLYRGRGIELVVEHDDGLHQLARIALLFEHGEGSAEVIGQRWPAVFARSDGLDDDGNGGLGHEKRRRVRTRS